MVAGRRRKERRKSESGGLTQPRARLRRATPEIAYVKERVAIVGSGESLLVVWREWVAVIGVSGLVLGLWLLQGLFVIAPEPVDDVSVERGRVGRLDLNRATEAELLRLPGVGQGLAARIVEHRRQVGGFQTIEQLTDVAGIGPQRLGQLRGFCFVAGEVESSDREVVPEDGRTVSVAGSVSTRR